MQSCKFYFVTALMVLSASISAQRAVPPAKKSIAAHQTAQPWKTLFNGKDLTGWDSWLRSTLDSGYNGPYHTPIALNNDPLHVFTVHDGMLHVSGEVWGAVTYKEDFGNYHLRFQTKWGEKKYAPKDKLARDGGLLFHCTEGYDYAFNCWMRSMEMQVQEKEIGDFFNVNAGDAEFQVTKNVKTVYNETADQYDADQPLARHPGRVWRSGDFESAKGEWTACELVARHADAVFIVNGFVVNRLFNIYRKDLGQQVTHGRIQFQSEGAEQFYKKIEIRPVSFKQSHPRLVAADSVINASAKSAITVTNEGDAIEIIAAELIGKDIDQFVVKLPSMPMVFKKGQQLILPVSVKDGYNKTNSVKFKLETVLGPVEGFSVRLESK